MLMSQLLNYPGPCPHCGSEDGYYLYEEVINKLDKFGGIKLVDTNGTHRRVCTNCEEEVM